MTKLTAIGLMSGTSMDGIDAALIKTDGGSAIEEIGMVSGAYDHEFHILLKAAEYAVYDCFGDLKKADHDYEDYVKQYIIEDLKIKDDVSLLTQLKNYCCHDPSEKLNLNQIIKKSTELHIDSVKQLLKKYNLKPEDIDVIGYHGQTLFHQPQHSITIQIGDGAYLAKKTGIMVVNNFRQNDVKHGGQGAPFAPLYHQALAICHKLSPVIMVNCGGIANITIITGAKENEVMGFDTGPGSGLLDRFVKERTKGQEPMDYDGKYGSQGKVNTAILKALEEKTCIKDDVNYYHQQPPKSLDIRDLQLIPALDQLSIEDGCATLAAFTVKTIIDSLSLLKNPPVMNKWIVAGGGWNNPVIYAEFERQLKKRWVGVEIYKANDIGWNSQSLEAEIFAYLAVRHLKQLPISYPSITNVPYPLSGGNLYRNDVIKLDTYSSVFSRFQNT